MILLVIGAGGAFKNVLVEGGISDYIKDATDGWSTCQYFLSTVKGRNRNTTLLNTTTTQ